MATLKHLSSKNADYGVAEQYLTFEHDEFTGKPILDENGRLVPRQDYRISSLNCGEKFMAVVRKYTSFEELTPTLLREFVEKIVVHECWKDEQGTRHQDIEIYYSFVGKVDLPDD